MAIRRARQDVVKSVRRERGEESGWLMSDGPKNLPLRLAHGIQLLHGVIGLHAHRGAPEDLARCIGCELRVHPRQDKALYRKCTEGPLWAIQYRLRGPEARPERSAADHPGQDASPLRALALATPWVWVDPLAPQRAAPPQRRKASLHLTGAPSQPKAPRGRVAGALDEVLARAGRRCVPLPEAPPRVGPRGSSTRSPPRGGMR